MSTKLNMKEILLVLVLSSKHATLRSCFFQASTTLCMKNVTVVMNNTRMASIYNNQHQGLFSPQYSSGKSMFMPPRLSDVKTSCRIQFHKVWLGKRQKRKLAANDPCKLPTFVVLWWEKNLPSHIPCFISVGSCGALFQSRII